MGRVEASPLHGAEGGGGEAGGGRPLARRQGRAQAQGRPAGGAGGSCQAKIFHQRSKLIYSSLREFNQYKQAAFCD